MLADILLALVVLWFVLVTLALCSEPVVIPDDIPGSQHDCYPGSTGPCNACERNDASRKGP